MDFEDLLLRLYRDKVGVRKSYPKSHWPECEWANGAPIVMPKDTPVRLISCNVCLRGRDYIRVVHCDPKIEGWPRDDRNCGACDHGNDCETWLRVRGAGRGVEQVLRRFDPRADHPVTWVETGWVPGRESDSAPLFDSKQALDQYCDDLLHRYPSECGYLALKGLSQDIYGCYTREQRE